MKNINKNLILDKIKQNLFPEVVPLHIYSKLFIGQSFALASVLVFCPQFGFGFFKGMQFDITQYFMMVSHEFCQIMCGFVMMYCLSLVPQKILKITEYEWFLEQKLLFHFFQVLVLSSFFWMMAPQILIYEYVLWLAGMVLLEIVTPEKRLKAT